MYTVLAMNLQTFDQRIISITDVRRDIDALSAVLAREKEAWVMRNQTLLFVAITPERYQEKYIIPNKTGNSIMERVEEIRRQHIMKGKTIANYVSQGREERIKKWTKQL